MKNKTLSKKFWLALTIFSLTGQIAWVVENMFLNVFIYRIFNASAADIALMVALSAVTAALTTIAVGALSDKIGKRKIFICGGYILWGISILLFSLLRMEWLTAITGSIAAAASLGISLVILLDCVMTFFGASANDASFNAWLVDSGKTGNRGAIEGINAMMPLLAVLVVFGGFMAFDLGQESSWTLIFLIIGFVVILIGILGFFLIDERSRYSEDNKYYFRNLVYSFRLEVIRENKLLYTVLGAFAVFGIAIQIYMPYLIIYYDVGLGIHNYTLVLAPAVLLAAGATIVFGQLYDRLWFRRAVYPAVTILIAGCLMLFFAESFVFVFIGSVLMMSGHLAGMAVFGAKIRDNTPRDKAGMFQGVRIFAQVLIPGVVGPMIGAFVLRDAQSIINADGTVSFIPNSGIFMASLIVAAIVLVILMLIFRMVRNDHRILPTDFADDNAIPFVEYPRPQLQRDSYFSLNGIWENGICVPFPPQSHLSGYHKKVGSRFTYARSFILPESFVKDRLLLHFGAVDQIAEVYINGHHVGSHVGGYLPFVLDITEAYHDGENQLVLKVKDTLSQKYPYGKQRKKKGEMWYTPISGIWQSVWLESVPAEYIEGVRITPDLSGIDLEINTKAAEYEVIIPLGDREIRKRFREKKVRIDLAEEGFIPILWTLENPHLYDLHIIAGSDKVSSYFGLRTVEIMEISGQKRICLNGKAIFLHGVLDQGYYSDGIYLPASIKGYEFDIRKMKDLGFNALRKMSKIEPECFYYLCDKMGMLVMQDMINSGRYSFFGDTVLPNLGLIKRNDSRRFRNQQHRDIFIKHTKDTLDHLYNHPCVIYYTIFNEGWGQFDSDRIYGLVKSWEPTRIIDSTSGWFINNKSDVDSTHIYFKIVELAQTSRPHVLSEFGGYARIIDGHCYSLHNQHGYGFYEGKDALTDQIIKTYEEMVLPAIEKGLCGSVYTQLSDIEEEVNGFYTYDRKVLKVDAKRMSELSANIKKCFQ